MFWLVAAFNFAMLVIFAGLQVLVVTNGEYGLLLISLPVLAFSAWWNLRTWRQIEDYRKERG